MAALSAAAVVVGGRDEHGPPAQEVEAEDAFDSPSSSAVPMIARTVGAPRYWSYGQAQHRAEGEVERVLKKLTPVAEAEVEARREPDLAAAAATSPPPCKKPHLLRPAVYESDGLDGWARPEAAAYDGLLVKRPFGGAWDGYARDVDEARARFDHVGMSVEAPAA